jgi:hypothetical protein
MSLKRKAGLRKTLRSGPDVTVAVADTCHTKKTPLFNSNIPATVQEKQQLVIITDNCRITLNFCMTAEQGKPGDITNKWPRN